MPDEDSNVVNIQQKPNSAVSIAGKKAVRGRPIQKGQVLNPKGRPVGSRNKLQESFIKKFYAKWEADGDKAIEEMTKTDPKALVQIAANLMPKQQEVSHVDVFNDMSVEELEAFLEKSA